MTTAEALETTTGNALDLLLDLQAGSSISAISPSGTWDELEERLVTVKAAFERSKAALDLVFLKRHHAEQQVEPIKDEPLYDIYVCEALIEFFETGEALARAANEIVAERTFDKIDDQFIENGSIHQLLSGAIPSDTWSVLTNTFFEVDGDLEKFNEALDFADVRYGIVPNQAPRPASARMLLAGAQPLAADELLTRFALPKIARREARLAAEQAAAELALLGPNPA